MKALCLKEDNKFIKELKQIRNNIPEYKLENDNGIMIDGSYQVIRFFKDDSITKIIEYNSTKTIFVSEDKEYLRSILENMYLTIENIISY